MKGSLFTKLAHRVSSIEGERYPLHVGDSWREPLEDARLENLRCAEIEGLHRYAQPHGHPHLLSALEERHHISRDRILTTTGATGGLGALAGALLAPGDEVLILAPFWPLIRGIVQAAGARVREVPFYLRPSVDGSLASSDVAELLLPHLSDRSVALYVNSPNNPTGLVLSAEVQEAIAEFARDHDLWLWSDEVYADYAYRKEHLPLRDFAAERCFTATSFSKAYAMAGNRVGALLGPTDPSAMSAVRKVSTHTFYSAPTGPQIAAARALNRGAVWLDETRDFYRESGDAAAKVLGVPPPDGGTFLFIHVGDALDERGLLGFLEDCIDDGLVLAPGSSCGQAYGDFVRLCFTSATPDCVARGVQKLARRLGRCS